MVEVRQGDRQHPVSETISVKDFPKARRDNASDAEVAQRPDCLFATRSASEVASRDQDFRLVEWRSRQNKGLAGGCLGTSLMEQMAAKPATVEQ